MSLFYLGDVVFVTEDKPHEVYVRDGDNIVMTKEATMVEALGGTSISFVTLDDRKQKVAITDVI